MAVAESMDVGQGAEALVRVELNKDHGHRLLVLVVMLKHAIYSLGDVVHDHIQVDLVLLRAHRGTVRT